MKLFLHTMTRVRIISGDLEWSGSPADFLALEPAYPGLPTLTQAPAAVRYQTPELKYLEDTAGQRHPDLFDALPYCDKIGTYTPGLCVYVQVTMSATTLNVDDTQAEIEFEAHFKAAPDPEAPDLPVTATWLIKLRHESGQTDVFEAAFLNGVCAYTYTYRAGSPLGDWSLAEADFAKVPIGEQTYTVKLITPVKFTLYRLL